MSFEGSIGEIDLVQRLVELGREHFTGAIRFEQDGIIKIVYFKGGDVLSASTNDRKDAIDEILLRAGKISREHIKQALSKRQESETLGDALLNLGFITRKELTWARRVQVIGILRSVRSWTTGTYAIVADYLPKREEGTLFPLAQIIVEFIVTEQDRQAFERAMSGGEAVFHKSASFDDAFRSLDLNEDAAEIAAQIDGEKSAAEIAGVTGKDAFNVYKLLEALRVLGLIEKDGAAAAPTHGAEDFSFESAGVADAADAWNATPEAEPALEVPHAAAEMPAWTLEPEAPPAPAAPAVVPPLFPADEAKVPFALSLDEPVATPPPSAPPREEPQWGFDEAQIEAAQRATAAGAPGAAAVPPKRPITIPQPKRKVQPKARGGRVFGIVVSLLLAAIIAAGWWWFHQRSTTPPAAVVAARPAKRSLIQPKQTMMPPAETATIVPVSSPPTATAAPAPAPATPSKQPAPVTTTAAEAPAVQSRLEQTSSGRMITNTPSEGTGDANRERYDAMARDYARKASGKYTVQFELVCQTSSLSKAVSAGGANVWFVPVSYRNQSCFRVFWGRFETRDQAVAALQHIPAGLKGSAPVIVSVPKS